MPRLKTQETYISECQEIHGDKYDYTNTIYEGAHNKVSVLCNRHQKTFVQKAYAHLQGQGCPLCGNENKNKDRQTTLEDFISKSEAIHGDAYDYSEVDYKGICTSVLIRCKKHDHKFRQFPYNHSVKGSTCPLCEAENTSKRLFKSQDEFIADCKARHGEKYDYSETVYTGNANKVDVRCHVHNEIFSINANSHMQGRGCAKCAENGYKRKRPGTLYVLSSASFTKIGITNNTAQRRASAMTKSSGEQFSVHSEWRWDCGGVADDLETHFLSILRSQYDSPGYKFDGHTECFSGISPLELTELIENKLKEQDGCN